MKIRKTRCMSTWYLDPLKTKELGQNQIPVAKVLFLENSHCA